MTGAVDHPVYVTGFDGLVRYFNHIPLIGVNDSGISIGQFPGEVMAVASVNMAVEKILRLVFVQQWKESLKSPVGRVISISQTLSLIHI